MKTELLFPFTAFFISALTVKILLNYLRKKQILDIPNERSSHSVPTPRGGGIGIIAGVCFSMLVYCFYKNDFNILVLLLPAICIAAIGLADDIKGGLNTGLRFLLQILIALFITWYFKPIEELPFPSPLNISTGYLAYPIAVIWLVGVTNIFNFLDGINGIAGVQTLVAGAAFAMMEVCPELQMLSICIAAASLGFLFFNWGKAKIFMGDVGSSFLGFLFAALPFFVEENIPRYDAFLGMAIFLWFFLIDGAFTMFRRLIKKEKIWEAHRSHIYQRLVISGYSHSTVVLIMAGLYFILLGVFFYVYNQYGSAHSWRIFLTGFLLFVFYALLASYQERKK